MGLEKVQPDEQAMKRVGKKISIARVFEEEMQKAIRAIDDSFVGSAPVSYSFNLFPLSCVNRGAIRILLVLHFWIFGYLILI